MNFLKVEREESTLVDINVVIAVEGDKDEGMMDSFFVVLE